MNKATRYNLISFCILLAAAIILFVLVGYDQKEHSFYSTGGIVYFTQFFILSAGVLALFFALTGTWQTWLQPVTSKTWALTLLVHFPLMFLSVLLSYAGGLFLQFIKNS